ncbi:MAG TPA: peptidoglycan-binding domain-containing protein [Acetobacteraceae bacterium]|nr:peptidoglycan-binding domain-containing protein [Acetobacteraceae bacterium]
MLTVRNLGLLLALSSVAVLPACSWFGGDSGSRKTSSASSSNYAPPPPSPQQAEAQQAVTPDTIRQVQQALLQQNMYRGQVDGVWGPQTQSAVRQYQQKNNLNASGQLDQQTLGSLNVGGGQNYGNNNGQPPSNQASGNAQPQPSQQNAQTAHQGGGTVTR